MDSARRGLDRLLVEFPHDRLISAAEIKDGPDGITFWTVVKLQGPSGLHSYAILNATGAVYEFDDAHSGALKDDPLLTVNGEQPIAVLLSLPEVRALARTAGLLSGVFTHVQSKPSALETAQMKLETRLMSEQAER